ncbi:MAG: peptidylprolyl isomerase [Proteobacteria bacterium]|nr:peptidylprolyl isomerase [Pseudomonadota bacterium]
MKPPLAIAAALVAFALAGNAQAQAADVADTGDPVVARVNGEAIHQGDVQLLFESLPEQYQQLPITFLQGQLIDHLINRKLLAQAARSTGLLEDDEVKRRIAFHEDDVLQQIYLSRQVAAGITDERLRAAYEGFLAGWKSEEEVHARHILVESEDEARAVIAELEAGADFAELAKGKSTGPTGPDGGDLDYFKQGQMVPEFSEAAFALQPGEITTEPVHSQFGWHVIKVEDRRKTAPLTFEESEAQLRAREMELLIAKITNDLRGEATIERLTEAGEAETEP